MERDERQRAAWRVMLAQQIDPKQLVFVDEMGTNTSLAPLRAWSPRGRRAYCSVPRNRGKNTTLLSSMTMEGMGPSLTVEGATTAAVFETYVERVLSPMLCPGQVVVMDNLTAHKGERVKELIEERGWELIYLPPYSPDFNPIEEAFAKIKGILRQSRSSQPRGPHRDHRSGDLSHQCSGCTGVLRALRIPCYGSTVLIAAVGPSSGSRGPWLHV
jgi:transposase